MPWTTGICLIRRQFLFNAESNSSNGRYIYNSLEATINNDKLWLYFGTGDKHRLQTKNSNVRNRLYGIKIKIFHYDQFYGW